MTVEYRVLVDGGEVMRSRSHATASDHAERLRASYYARERIRVETVNAEE